MTSRCSITSSWCISLVSTPRIAAALVCGRLEWLPVSVVRDKGPWDSSLSVRDAESNGRAATELEAVIWLSGDENASEYLAELRMQWACTRLAEVPERGLCGLS